MQGNGEGAKPKPVLCAGQGCGRAKLCMRFRIRVGGATWASYDIESRDHFEGDCHAYVPATFVRSTARH